MAGEGAVEARPRRGAKGTVVHQPNRGYALSQSERARVDKGGGGDVRWKKWSGGVHVGRCCAHDR